MMPFRNTRLALVAWLSVLLLTFHAAQAQTFQHPGVLVSRAQLEYMKTMVAAHTEPFYSAFTKAQKSDIGSLNYTPYGPPSDGYIKCGPTSNPNIGCSNSDDDSSAAYLQSLLWYITGNQQYAKNAINILNLYGHNLKGYSTGATYSNAPLQAAWDGEKWPRAAEIIRYSNAGWSESDISAFKAMLNTAILPLIAKGSTSNGNWEISMIEALINIGVFNDDLPTFNTGVTYWKQRIPAYFYYHTDGSQPVPAPRGTANWYGQNVYNASVDGISQETCRDFGHAQYGISGALDAAETALIQGIDLYNDANSNARNRLTAALEFNAYYLLGNPVPSYVCGGKVSLQVYPTDEIGYNEYHKRLGIDLPLTRQYLQSVIRQLANPTEYHIMVYETLTHGGDASSLAPFLLRTPNNASSVRAGGTANYELDVIPGSDPNPQVTFAVNGLPAGVTATITPGALTGAGAAALTVSATNASTAGSYTFTVTGSNGGVTQSVPLTLIVNSGSADFTIATSPSVAATVAGDTLGIPITFSSQSGYLGGVNLAVASGLPPGATASFLPTSIGLGSPTSTLSLITSPMTATGAYPIVISATDGSVTHFASLLLTINPLANTCVPQLGNYWLNGVIPTQAGIFTAEWDATPSTALNNTNVGLSLGPQSAFTGLAISARFNPSGSIDARNGAAFAASTNVPYQANVTYHFRAVVNVPSNTYSIYVTPRGQSEMLLGSNFAFRTEQAGINSLDHWDATSQVGTVAVCNLMVDAPPMEGQVQLTAVTQITNAGDGTYQAVMIIGNNGSKTAQDVHLSGVTIAGVSGSAAPTSLGSIAAGASVTVGVSIPSAVGTPGTRVVEQYSGYYTGGSFGGGTRLVLPSSASTPTN